MSTVIDRAPDLCNAAGDSAETAARLRRILQTEVHNQKRILVAQIESAAGASNETSKESRLEQ